MKYCYYILLLSVILLNGCQGYIGGLDDSNAQFVQLVFINRSSHDIDLIIKDPVWSEGPDTIRLEKGNGLWKREFGEDYLYTNHFYDEAEIVADGREKFLFESTGIPYSPCSLNPLNDSKGTYYVYDFSDKAYEEIRRTYEELRKFTMTDIPPSYILHDSLITAGSSEALFRCLYPVPSVRKSLKLGSVVGKEAERIDKVKIYEEYGTAPGKVEVSEDRYTEGRKDKPYMAYYSIEELSKAGLAHFGCDFGELTGRKEFDRFCGCIYSITETVHREVLQENAETSEFMMNLTDDKAVVQFITYGSVRILLVEADCMHSKLMNHMYYNVLTDTGNPYFYVPDMTFYLLSLDENGEFQCKSGRREIVNEWLYGSEDAPVVAIDYGVSDFTDAWTYVHIHDDVM